MLKNAVLLLCILIVLLAVYFLILEFRRKLQGRHCPGCTGCDSCKGCSETEAERGEAVLKESRNKPL